MAIHAYGALTFYPPFVNLPSWLAEIEPADWLSNAVSAVGVLLGLVGTAWLAWRQNRVSNRPEVSFQLSLPVPDRPWPGYLWVANKSPHKVRLNVRLLYPPATRGFGFVAFDKEKPVRLRPIPVVATKRLFVEPDGRGIFLPFVMTVEDRQTHDRETPPKFVLRVTVRQGLTRWRPFQEEVGQVLPMPDPPWWAKDRPYLPMHDMEFLAGRKRRWHWFARSR